MVAGRGRVQALVSADEIQALAATFATYNRGNAQNLLTLCALLVSPATVELQQKWRSCTATGAPASAIPPVPELEQLPSSLVAKVLELNRLRADGAPQQIVATLHKHLAHWLGSLDLTLRTLSPLARSGALVEAVQKTHKAAVETAAGLAKLRVDLGEDEVGIDARAKIQVFTEHLICRLLPIGLTLQKSHGHC